MRLTIAGSPIAIIAGGIVILELALFAKAAVTRYPVATALSTNVGTLRGQPCALADKVLVEPDANAGMLVPASGRTASEALAARTRSASPRRHYDQPSAEMGGSRPGQATWPAPRRNRSPSWARGIRHHRRRGPRTVNGSTAALPYGLKPATTPVLGSFGFNGEARLTTDWYRLPARNSSPLLVVTAAGAISTTDAFGATVFGQSLRFQFGKRGQLANSNRWVPVPSRSIRARSSRTGRGATCASRCRRHPRGRRGPVDRAGQQPRRGAVHHADTAARAAGRQPAAPRRVDRAHVDRLHGRRALPVPAADGVRYGVAEIPQWRILPDYAMALSQSRTWMNTAGGGLLAISDAMTTSTAVPSYLDGDWHRGWGALERLDPREPQARPAVVTTDIRRQWGWSRTGSIRLEPSKE